MNMLKVRDSNMEMLRIVAMILVMVVHADFRSLPVPTLEETIGKPVSSLLRFGVESLSIISVNVFVLLSGWYGIRVRLERILEFIFQVSFFILICFVFALIVGIVDLNVSTLRNLLLLEPFDYWFFKAYMMMYLMSPLMNAFIEKASRRQMLVWLLAFFIFQTIYGWASKGAVWFNYGYSGVSFMGLYMLARYLRIYQPSILRWNRNIYLFLYLSIAVFDTLLSYIVVRLGYGKLEGTLRHYTYPLIIMQAVCFLVYFSKISIKSKFINWLSISSFSIYLIHSNMMIGSFIYDDNISRWFYQEDTMTFVVYTVFLMFVIFWFSIFADKIRILFWKFIKGIYIRSNECSSS